MGRDGETGGKDTSGDISTQGEGLSSSRKPARGRYVVTPSANAEKSSRPAAKGPRKKANKASGQNKRPAARSGKPPVKKRLPDDPDHQWLKNELRSAQTVAQVLGRQVQYENKIRALKLRHEPGRPLYDYAERMEKLLLRLKTYPWTAQLRDLRQDDSVIKKLKL